VLDLDLLLFGDRRIDDARLRVPHPGIAERIFVLRPLADLAPDLDVPGLGTVADLLARIPEDGLWRLEEAEG
jgi:2-amino-4-hydroxy-6-hydroxymethyldihydropteridine diphosphokinase